MTNNMLDEPTQTKTPRTLVYRELFGMVREAVIITYGVRYGKAQVDTDFSVLHLKDISLPDVLEGLYQDQYGFVISQPITKATIDSITNYIDLTCGTCPGAYGIHCKTGRLRSVVVGEVVGERLIELGVSVVLYHRDRLRGSYVLPGVTCAPIKLGKDIAIE